MIISRTPFRISFFGGGTDYPAWYKDNEGAVLATAIDKYCYITCRYLPPFFEHKSRIVYSQIELVNDFEEIRHPAVRETLKFMNIDRGVEIHHDGDLPARAGLGSSSAFTVGLLNALYALKGKIVDEAWLAQEAIKIEQEVITENVGSQDQVTAAFGGLNRIEFNSEGFRVKPVNLNKLRSEALQNHLMLFFTGISRTASHIAGEQIKEIPNRKRELSEMCSMVYEAIRILESDRDFEDFGRLMHESWMLKRRLSSKVSSLYIDYIYDMAIKAGAAGGKVLGAGGGGFMLFLVRPELRDRVERSLNGLLHVPFRFESAGSKIIYQA